MQPLLAHITQWLQALGLHPAPDSAVGQAAGAASTLATHAVSKLDMPALLALAAALGWASGFRLYAVVFLTGALGYMDWITLPPGLAILQHPIVLGVSLFMLLVEFFADKIPWVDSLWDAVHSVIRIPAGALLAAGVVGADPHTTPALTMAVGLLGGTLAATSYATKAATRAAINTSPEPFSNGLASLFEDGLSIVTVWLATHHPLGAAVLVAVALVISVLLLIVLFKFFKNVLRTLRHVFGGTSHLFGAASRSSG
jgi:hypothetical protein